jgi:hypothetical protein
VLADIWFGLDNGQYPGWSDDEFETSHRRSRWPDVVRPARDVEHMTTPWTSRDLPGVSSLLKGSEPLPRQSARRRTL